MGVLKTITDEYFGDSIRKEDKIDISGLDVEIVSFTDKNNIFHKKGFKLIDDDQDNMIETLGILIERIIEKRGPQCSLNDIDVSNIRDMESVFAYSKFDGDISGWDIKNVKSMKRMFYNSKFTGKNGIFRLEKGNKVIDMGGMFFKSDFNGDISGWDVSNVLSMMQMFSNSNFDGDLSKWNVKNVASMDSMFYNSKFTGKNGIFKVNDGYKISNMEYMFFDSEFEGDINDWDVGECFLYRMLENTPLEKNNKLPQWYLDRQ